MSAADLEKVAQDFFAGIVDPKLRPPSAPMCNLRQNGVGVGNGMPSCSFVSTAERFEQLRFPVIDVQRGLVGAEGRGRGAIVQVLLRIEESTSMQSAELPPTPAAGSRADAASGVS
jgi:hypothetical protein